MITSNVSEIYWFKKNREAREYESVRVRERECDSEGEISLPRNYDARKPYNECTCK